MGAPTTALPDGTEDTPYTILDADLLAGFSDADGDSLAVASLAVKEGAAGDALVNNADGSFTYTPAANQNGRVVLSYDVIDGNGGVKQTTQSFTLQAGTRKEGDPASLYFIPLPPSTTHAYPAGEWAVSGC